MSILNNLLIFTTFLLVIFSFGLGIFSLYRNPKAKVVRLWFLTSMAVGLWSMALFLVFITHDKGQGILYSQLLHLGAVFLPIFFLHFVLAFLYKDKEKRLLIILGYCLAVFFGILSFTKFIVADATAKFGFDFWVDGGSLYPLLLIYFWLYALVSIYFLWQGYRQSDGVIKRKIFYILLAAVIGFAAGGTCYLPQTLGIYPFGQFFTWLYPILITYGILVDEFKIKF